MDILNEEKLQATGVALIDHSNAALAQTADDLVARLRAASIELVDRFIEQEKRVISDALTALVDVESKAALDVQAIVGILDGWTFTITLRKPHNDSDNESLSASLGTGAALVGSAERPVAPEA